MGKERFFRLISVSFAAISRQNARMHGIYRKNNLKSEYPQETAAGMSFPAPVSVFQQ